MNVTTCTAMSVLFASNTSRRQKSHSLRKQVLRVSILGLMTKFRKRFLLIKKLYVRVSTEPCALNVPGTWSWVPPGRSWCSRSSAFVVSCGTQRRTCDRYRRPSDGICTWSTRYCSDADTGHAVRCVDPSQTTRLSPPPVVSHRHTARTLEPLRKFKNVGNLFRN